MSIEVFVLKSKGIGYAIIDDMTDYSGKIFLFFFAVYVACVYLFQFWWGWIIAFFIIGWVIRTMKMLVDSTATKK